MTDVYVALRLVVKAGIVALIDLEEYIQGEEVKTAVNSFLKEGIMRQVTPSFKEDYCTSKYRTHYGQLGQDS